MSLILRIKSGPLEGKTYSLQEGHIIGRSGVEISIPDPKMSNKHARVTKSEDGNWVLMDMGSTNGLRVGGKRLAQTTLQAGMDLMIGKTEFDVLFAPQPQGGGGGVSDNTATQPPLPMPKDEFEFEPFLPPILPEKKDGNAPPEIKQKPLKSAPSSQKKPAPEPIPVVQQEWNEYFDGIVDKALSKIASVPKDLRPFAPLVVLTVYRGLQVGTEWTLGYGPRTVGLASNEFPLFEPGAPPAGFTLTPQQGTALYQTANSGKFLLNGKPVAADELKDGDVISVGETFIRVSFKE